MPLGTDVLTSVSSNFFVLTSMAIILHIIGFNTLIDSVSLNISAEFLAQRSWKGLEVKRGETPVTKALEGRTGIASFYTHESIQDKNK